MAIDIPSLVVAAGGELVGKVRLQKMVYLLDQLGLKSGYTYEYHHYGPYSEDLAEQTDDDVVFGRLRAKWMHRQSDGAPYVAYSAAAGPDQGLEGDRLRKALVEMQSTSATVLELAATMHWLFHVERMENWHGELIRRKGIKCENGREQKALELLKALSLPPAVTSDKAQHMKAASL